LTGQENRWQRRTGGKAEMTLIEIIISGAIYVLKAIFALVIIGVLLLLLIIARETAWYIRRQNEKKMEEKKNEDGSI